LLNCANPNYRGSPGFTRPERSGISVVALWVTPTFLELKCTLLWLGGNKLTDPLPDWISPAVFQEYLRTFRRPDTIHAICEDYRAAASIDLAHDKADLEKKIQCPLLVLWSEKGPFHRMYNVLQTWQERAVLAKGKVMPTGHFLPEQMPQELTREITTFLRA